MPHRQPLAAHLDHVAVAVADLEAAALFWQRMGATAVMGSRGPTFDNEQVQLSNGGKIELIAPGSDASFMTTYLDRFGAGRIHHITLKLGHALAEGIERLGEAGVEVVDVSEADADWHEAFLRPSQVGGLIVQIAVARLSDTEFARSTGRPPPAPTDPTAPALQRIVLGHTDLTAARGLWTVLGADVAGDHETGFLATFPDSPVRVEVRSAAVSGPIGLASDGWAVADPGPYAPALLSMDNGGPA